VGGRHLLDVHAAVAGGHEHGPGERAVHGDTHVQLARDVATLLDQQPAHHLAFRPGLDRHQRVAQQVAGGAGGVLGRAHDLDAALPGDVLDGPFAASPGVDLRLDDRQLPAQGVEGVDHRARRVGHNPAGNRHAGVAEDLLGLVLVDLHRFVRSLLSCAQGRQLATSSLVSPPRRA